MAALKCGFCRCAPRDRGLIPAEPVAVVRVRDGLGWCLRMRSSAKATSGRRFDLPRNDFGAGLAGPSDLSGLLDVFDVIPSRGRPALHTKAATTESAAPTRPESSRAQTERHIDQDQPGPIPSPRRHPTDFIERTNWQIPYFLKFTLTGAR